MKEMKPPMKRLKLERGKLNLNRVYTESTSKGNQIKYTNGDIWVKENLLGYEDIAEVFVSSLLKCSTLEEHEYVDYKLCESINEITGEIKDGSVSNSFLREGESHITFMSMFRDLGIRVEDINSIKDPKEKINFVIDVIGSETGLDITDYLRKVFTLDAVVLNEDRHLNNLSVLYGNGKYSIAPIFDNGLSLLSDIKDYPLGTPPTILIRKVKSRPFSTNFKKQYNLLGTGFNLDVNKVKSLADRYNDERITAVMRNAMINYPEVFRDNLKETKTSTGIRGF